MENTTLLTQFLGVQPLQIPDNFIITMVRQPFGGPVSYGNGACTFKYGGNDPCSCKAFEPGDPDCCANCGHSQGIHAY
ncbi:unnamed protein product [Adineta steineri]|uniref:Uncharacterized protein n=1 Tax=Adineta steineri TaxID=433720 RepID=A0A819QDG3_9BILA|nr:unnamed protein product [Adineta steineri]